jgi:hypothetical protein
MKSFAIALGSKQLSHCGKELVCGTKLALYSCINEREQI